MVKGQVALTGFILLIALVAITLPILSDLTRSVDTKTDRDLGQYSKLLISELSLAGVPESWTAQSVNRPGIMNDGTVDVSKLYEFAQLDYDETKMKLGLGTEEYIFFFEDTVGNKIPVAGKIAFGWKGDDTPGNGMTNWDVNWGTVNAAARNLAKSEKSVTLNGEPAKLVVYIWGVRTALDVAPNPACFNGADDDGDGRIDYPFDPGCTAFNDESEENDWPPGFDPACADGVDNDLDGFADFPYDPGCVDASSTDETDPPTAPQCADSIDNDGDSLIDFLYDSGCQSASDDDETDVPQAECFDGIDNDENGETDFPNDPGCESKEDLVEWSSASSLTLCFDGLDNDVDGLPDYPWDLGCIFAGANSESDLGSCGNGLIDPGEECEVYQQCSNSAQGRSCIHCTCQNASRKPGEAPPGDPPPPDTGGGTPNPPFTGECVDSSISFYIPFSISKITTQCCKTDVDCGNPNLVCSPQQTATCTDANGNAIPNCGVCMPKDVLNPTDAPGAPTSTGGACSTTLDENACPSNDDCPTNQVCVYSGTGCYCAPKAATTCAEAITEAQCPTSDDCPSGQTCVYGGTGCYCDQTVTYIFDTVNMDFPGGSVSGLDQGQIANDLSGPMYGNDQAFILGAVGPGSYGVLSFNQPAPLVGTSYTLHLQVYSSMPSPMPVTAFLIVNGQASQNGVVLNNYANGGMFDAQIANLEIPLSEWTFTGSNFQGMRLEMDDNAEIYVDNINIQR